MPRRSLFIRLAFTFTLMTVFIILGGSSVAYWLVRWATGAPLWEGDQTRSALVIYYVLTVLLPVLGIWLALRIYRDVVRPLSDVIAAAQRLATGDLSAQVRVDGSGDFRRLAKTFNEMVAKLQRADQQRRHLTADIAHELRTPVHALQGQLEGALDGIYEPTSDYLVQLLDRTHLLARLIDDLHTLTLAESDQLILRLERVQVAGLLQDVVTVFEHQAAAQHVDLCVSGNPTPYVEVDWVRMHQVLANIVANALHHTPPGGQITLSAAAHGTWVQISVTDTGEGIPSEDLPYVFDRFWRGGIVRTRREGVGSGLGLTIARYLVEHHSGTIDVQSEPGNGTCFTVTLPGM